MNPFQEDEEEPPPPPPLKPSKPSSLSTSSSSSKRPFETVESTKLRGYQSADTTSRNPFAEDVQAGGNGGRGSAPSSFQEPNVVMQRGQTPGSSVDSKPSVPGNPFAPSPSVPGIKLGVSPMGSREAMTDLTASKLGSSTHDLLANTTASLNIVQTEYRDSILKAFAVGHGFGLFATQSPAGKQPGTAPYVVTLRNLSSIGKVDASLALKETVDNVFMDPAAMTGLVVVRTKEASGQVIFINPQEAVLKARGPLPALSGLSAVGWYKNDLGDYDALAGTASGSIVRCRFSHSGLASSEPVGAFKSKIVGVLPRLQRDGFYAVESSGLVQLFGWSGKDLIARCDILPEQRQTVKEAVSFALLAPDGDIWVASVKGLHRVSIEQHSTAAAQPLVLTSSLVLEQEGIESIAQSALFVIVLSRVANKQSSVLFSKLSVVSKVSHRAVVKMERSKVAVQGSPARILAVDDTTNRIWLASDTGVALTEITDELTGAWRLYLKRGVESNSLEDFQRAVDLAQTKQDVFQVRAAWGDWLFSNKRYSLAAEQFAMTSNVLKPFEEVALKLTAAAYPGESAAEARDRRKGLRVFLLKRLERFPENKETPRTMLSTWICEAFLDEMDNLDSSAREESAELDAAFCEFLGTYAAALEPAKEIIFHLILSHGRSDLLLAYAFLTRDYDRVVGHHLQRDAPAEAVRTMRDCARTDSALAAQLFYKHSPVLIERCPALLVDTWLELDESLDPVKLVPAISKFENSPEASVRMHALRFLEHCVNKLHSREEAIHNALLSAYSSDERAFSAFIQAEALRPGGFCFDVGYALRLCERTSPHSKVVLLSAIGSAEAACVAALDLGMREAAQRIAREQFALNSSLSKRLWLLCCKDALEKPGGGSPSANALQVLRASEGAIDIESVLQLMPESLTLDEVREEVCAALERYNGKIDALKTEMKQQFESEQNLRRVAREERQRFDLVRASKKCDHCKQKLFVEAPLGTEHGDQQYVLANKVDEFYVFPCTHVFHTECLLLRLVPAERALAMERRASTLESDQARAEEIIAASCPLCGDRMIESIDMPLIFAKDEEEARRWDVPRKS